MVLCDCRACKPTAVSAAVERFPRGSGDPRELPAYNLQGQGPTRGNRDPPDRVPRGPVLVTLVPLPVPAQLAKVFPRWPGPTRGNRDPWGVPPWGRRLNLGDRSPGRGIPTRARGQPREPRSPDRDPPGGQGLKLGDHSPGEVHSHEGQGNRFPFSMPPGKRVLSDLGRVAVRSPPTGPGPTRGNRDTPGGSGLEPGRLIPPGEVHFHEGEGRPEGTTRPPPAGPGGTEIPRPRSPRGGAAVEPGRPIPPGEVHFHEGQGRPEGTTRPPPAGPGGTEIPRPRFPGGRFR